MARKAFVLCTGWMGGTYVRTDSRDTICPPHIENGRGITNYDMVFWESTIVSTLCIKALGK